jgi:hypothetical protein
MTLTDIEKLTKDYADARELLGDRVAALNDDIELLRRGAIKGIKAAVKSAAEKQAELKAAIEAAPELFGKPKTLVLHGVRVGFMKGKGQISWDDETAVLTRIRKMFTVDADAYLSITVRPSKTALATLPAADLKKLGVTVIEAGEQVLIKPTDSDVDKLVAALLKDAAEEAQS